MKKLIYILPLFLMIISCSNSEQKTTTDTTEKQATKWSENEQKMPAYSNEPIETANYIPLYIGALDADKITIDYALSFYQRFKPKKDSLEYVVYNQEQVNQHLGAFILPTALPSLLRGDSAEIQIKIDPTFELSSISVPEKEDTVIAHKAWAVIITNPHEDSIIIGRGKYIDLTLEGLDTRTNNWQAVEKNYEYPYATWLKMPLLIIPPKQSAITSLAMPRDTSQFKTFRLFMGDNVSSKIKL